MSHRLEALVDHHELDAFRCGIAALDNWLACHARRATGQGTRTYVLLPDDHDTVVGYVAIAPHLLERELTPRAVGRGAPARIPAILLAKLALQASLHGTGLGRELLIHALQTIVTAARAAGGRLIVVDAIDGTAAGFCAAHDFRPLPDDPHRLFMKLSTAARALDLPWP